MPAGGSCLLGSINLSEFVINEFKPNARFDYAGFNEAVNQSVIALNEVLYEGLPLHPLEEQKISVNDWRQIGLGILGWHDCLIKLGIRYGSVDSIDLANIIGFEMINTSILSSSNLVDTYGTYPKYKKEAIKISKFFNSNTEFLTRDIVNEKGLANSQLLTIAPTGSIGTMLGVSTGIEAIYNISYTRKTESLHGEDKYYKVYTPIVERYMKANNIIDEKDLPNYFNTAMTLNYMERIKMQSVWQQHIDASISSTINIPNSFTVEEVENLYIEAYKHNLKGVTIYRDGCARSGILTNEAKKEEPLPYEYVEFPRGFIEDVPQDLNYRKYCLFTGCGKLYFFLGVDETDGKIYDCFCNTDGVSGCNINTQAVSRLLSAGIRGGIPVEYLIKQLDKAGVCPSYQYHRGKGEKLSKGKACASSIGNVIKDVLKEFAEDKDLHNQEVKKENPKKQSVTKENLNFLIADSCPECGKKSYVSEGGCGICKECGFSRCN